ncbi:MAG TPA: hypothetical protein VKB19_19860 [Pedobacter sp.]|nr:hypothetical protein [Pedobacter sp.]
MKANALNYKILLKFSPAIVGLLCILVWQVALKKTWEQYRLSAMLEENKVPGRLSISPAYTSSRAELIDSLYTQFEVDTLLWKSQLWNDCAILSQKNRLSVKEFPVWQSIEVGGKHLLKQEVALTGSYADLIRMQHDLASMKRRGGIASLNYQRSSRDQQTTLTLVLLGIPKEKGNYKDE